MKMKAFALGGLCLVGWALSTCQASAFHVMPKCFHKNYSVIVCRPYNAFTPICYGNMVCDGCCPSPYCCGPSCQLPIQRCFGPTCGGLGYDQGGFSQYAVSQPVMMPAPSAQAPYNPGFTAPPPTPNAVFNQTSMRYPPQGMSPVQPAGYYPPQYPAYPMNYYPINNYPMVPPMQVPSYWYGQ